MTYTFWTKSCINNIKWIKFLCDIEHQILHMMMSELIFCTSNPAHWILHWVIKLLHNICSFAPFFQVWYAGIVQHNCIFAYMLNRVGFKHNKLQIMHLRITHVRNISFHFILRIETDFSINIGTGSWIRKRGISEVDDPAVQPSTAPPCWLTASECFPQPCECIQVQGKVQWVI
jgi:hypothetical protein